MAENLILFKTDDGQIKLDVKLDSETVWLTHAQMAALFERDIKTIGKHINNALNALQLSQNLRQLPPTEKPNAGSVSHHQAVEKATNEYKKHQAKTLSSVERDFLSALKKLPKK